FEQHTLGFHFPGASLEALSWEGKDDDDGVFTVAYKFHAPQMARRVGRGLVLPAPFPAELGKRYIGVAARTTPLYVDYAPPTRSSSTRASACRMRGCRRATTSASSSSRCASIAPRPRRSSCGRSSADHRLCPRAVATMRHAHARRLRAPVRARPPVAGARRLHGRPG